MEEKPLHYIAYIPSFKHSEAKINGVYSAHTKLIPEYQNDEQEGN